MQLKCGEVHFNRITVKDHPTIDELIREAERAGMNVRREHIQAMNLNCSVQGIRAFTWMDWHFNLVGDQQPNRDEIHLETQYCKTVYEEFLSDETLSQSPDAKDPVSYAEFCRLWLTLFPHVRTREYKQVTGEF